MALASTSPAESTAAGTGGAGALRTARARPMVRFEPASGSAAFAVPAATLSRLTPAVSPAMGIVGAVCIDIVFSLLAPDSGRISGSPAIPGAARGPGPGRIPGPACNSESARSSHTPSPDVDVLVHVDVDAVVPVVRARGQPCPCDESHREGPSPVRVVMNGIAVRDPSRVVYADALPPESELRQHRRT